jgi:hypothetical protein
MTNCIVIPECVPVVIGFATLILSILSLRICVIKDDFSNMTIVKYMVWVFCSVLGLVFGCYIVTLYIVVPLAVIIAGYLPCITVV